MAAAEKIDRSYLCRVRRLTLLAPEIVEAIMDGRQAEEITLPVLMKGFPVEWEGQRPDCTAAGERRPPDGRTQRMDINDPTSLSSREEGPLRERVGSIPQSINRSGGTDATARSVR